MLRLGALGATEGKAFFSLSFEMVAFLSLDAGMLAPSCFHSLWRFRKHGLAVGSSSVESGFENMQPSPTSNVLSLLCVVVGDVNSQLSCCQLDCL